MSRSVKPFAIACLLLVAAAAPAAARDALALGGALRPPGEANPHILWESGNASAGLVSPVANGGSASGRMQLGGLVAWRGDGFRLDATVAPSIDGGVAAGIGGVLGALPGDIGTSYSLRFGAELAGDRVTINPARSLGLAEVGRPGSDVNMTVTVNHALTPGLSVTGTAEARRSVGPANDGVTNQNRFLFGAGLGYRF